MASKVKPVTEAAQPGDAAGEGGRAAWWRWALAAAGLAGLGLLGLRRRRLPTSAEAYQRLKALAERGRIEVPESTAPLALLARLGAADSALGEAASPVVDLYLAETFGGRVVSLEERRSLVAALVAAEHCANRRRREQDRGRRRNKGAAAA